MSDELEKIVRGIANAYGLEWNDTDDREIRDYADWYIDHLEKHLLGAEHREEPDFWDSWDMSEKLRKYLNRLSVLQKQILYCYEGLDIGRRRSPGEVAKFPEFDCPADYIEHALSIIRDYLKRNDVGDEWNALIQLHRSSADQLSGISNAQQLLTMIEHINPRMEESTLPKIMMAKNRKKCDAFCEKLRKVMHKNLDEYIECRFWCSLPRGTFEDYVGRKQERNGRYSLYDEDELPDYRKDWEKDCAEESQWFRISIVKEKNALSVAISGICIINGYEENDIFTRESRLHWEINMEPMFDFLDQQLEQYEALRDDGQYYKMLEEKLPYRHRAGSIRLSDYWKFVPRDFDRTFSEIDEKLKGDYVVAIKPQGTSFPFAYRRNHGITLDEIGNRQLPRQCPEEMIKLIRWFPVEAEDEKFVSGK